MYENRAKNPAEIVLRRRRNRGGEFDGGVLHACVEYYNEITLYNSYMLIKMFLCFLTIQDISDSSHMPSRRVRHLSRSSGSFYWRIILRIRI
jgi:hypothetical protein